MPKFPFPCGIRTEAVHGRFRVAVASTVCSTLNTKEVRLTSDVSMFESASRCLCLMFFFFFYTIEVPSRSKTSSCTRSVQYTRVTKPLFISARPPHGSRTGAMTVRFLCMATETSSLYDLHTTSAWPIYGFAPVRCRNP